MPARKYITIVLLPALLLGWAVAYILASGPLIAGEQLEAAIPSSDRSSKRSNYVIGG